MCPDDHKSPPLGNEQPESKSYRQMLLDVEGICRDIARPDLDLDEMISKVERGYQLISKMRERLDRTRSKIDQLRGEMEGQDKPKGEITSP
jgi:exodeoxyribonuclease VII small subunit